MKKISWYYNDYIESTFVCYENNGKDYFNNNSFYFVNDIKDEIMKKMFNIVNYIVQKYENKKFIWT